MLTFTTRKKAAFILFFVLLCSTFSFSQEIEWQNTIGGSDDDELYSIKQTADGGYILGGTSYSPISGDKTENSMGINDYWLIKTDENGSIQWQNTIGGSEYDHLRKIQQTNDGGYILGGYSNSGISGDKTENNWDVSLIAYDYWIVKTDSMGLIQWQNTIGGVGHDILVSVQQTSDNGFILGGSSKSNISGDKSENSRGEYDYWILKTDSVGNLLWQKTIGGSDIDYLLSIDQTNDSGYILGGYSRSDTSGDKTENSNGSFDYWIVKTDSLGGIIWQNTIGGSNGDILTSLQQTNDGGYILAGSSLSSISGDKTENNIGSGDYWIVKTDEYGNIQWQNTIGGNGNENPNSIQQSNNGGYIVGGWSQSTISGDVFENSYGAGDYWVLEIDSSGVIQNQNLFGGDKYDELTSIGITNDGGYITGGYSASNASGDKSENCFGWISDYWIVKLTNNYNLIKGKTFLDLNNNQIQDSGEANLTNKKITESVTNRFAFSQPNGFYSVSVLDTGTFTVTHVPISYYNIVPANHAATFTSFNQTDSLNDFAFQPLGTFNDLCVTLTPLGAFRPGFNASYMINYENVGTTTLSPTVTLYQNSLLSYISSSVAPTVTSTDSVQWSGLPLLSPFQSGSILVTLNISASAVIGSNIYSQCIIEPIANDYNVYCNYAGATVVVTGSIDPNDILVSEDTLTTTQLATQPFLDYTIRFQNTGNDTAFTVKIINPIDTNKLELSSIEFVNASHPVQLKWVNYNKNMEFLLENILLPDSNVNEPESHGFVHYRIKPKTSLLAGDSATNKGYIYFDFNAPVGTNMAVTKIVLPTGIKQLAKDNWQLAVFPNPTKDELNIQLNQIVQKGKQEITISIFDVLGNIVLSRQSGSANCKLPTAHFSKGIYFVEVKTGTEVYRAKFVKE